MNVSDFTYLLQHPGEVLDKDQTRQLEDVLDEYPYFQAASALHLKGLRNLNSFQYNNALKVTAACTADRDILFRFYHFGGIPAEFHRRYHLGKTNPLKEHPIIAEEVVPDPGQAIALIETSEDEPLPRSAKDADDILDPSLFKSKDPEVDKALAAKRKKAASDLEIGRPLTFTRKEKYSFGEWLATHLP